MIGGTGSARKEQSNSVFSSKIGAGSDAHVPAAMPKIAKQESTVRQLWVDKHKPMTMTHLVGNGDKVCVYVCVYVCVCMCALGG